MADPNFEFFRKTQQQLGSEPTQLLEGEVIGPVTGSGQPVNVRPVPDPSGGRLSLGLASYPQPVGGSGVPKPGDKCLVALDQNHKPWIVAWQQTGWPNPSGTPITGSAIAAAGGMRYDGQFDHFRGYNVNEVADFNGVWYINTLATEPFSFPLGPKPGASENAGERIKELPIQRLLFPNETFSDTILPTDPHILGVFSGVASARLYQFKATAGGTIVLPKQGNLPANVKVEYSIFNSDGESVLTNFEELSNTLTPAGAKEPHRFFIAVYVIFNSNEHYSSPVDINLTLTGTAVESVTGNETPDKDVAHWVPATAGPQRVTALPTNPFDGQEIDYVVDATNGIVWRFRYRAASASTHKWEFVGGPPLYVEVAAEQSTSSGSFVDLATVGPEATVPVAGDYLITFGTRQLPSAAGFAETGLFIGGVQVTGLIVIGNTASEQANVSRTTKAANVAASSAVKLKYLSTTGSGSTFLERWLSIVPTRVG